MPRMRKSERPDAILQADRYLTPGAVVVIAASPSRTWYVDRGLFTELLVWLRESQVKPVVVASRGVHSAISEAASAAEAEIALLGEESAAARGFIEDAVLGVVLAARKSKDPCSAGIAAQGLISYGIPMLCCFDDGTTELITSTDKEEWDGT